jgi:hypothetical protein
MFSRRLLVPAWALVALLVAVSLLPAGAPPQPPAEAVARSGVLDPDLFCLRLLLGMDDQTVTPCSGTVRLDRGEVVALEGWRFRKGDRIGENGSWRATSHTVRKGVGNVPRPGQAGATLPRQTGPSTFGPPVTPNGVVLALRAPLTATLAVETDRGRFSVPLADLASGAPRRYLGGEVEAQRVPASAPLREGPSQDDFPAAAAGRDGAVWVAFVHHEPRGPEFVEALRQRPKSFADFVPQGGGDQIKLIRFSGGRAAAPIDVTEPGLDVWRPSVAVAGDGTVVVAWSESQGGNWDLYARRFDPAAGAWAERTRLTTNPGTDTDVVLATAADGSIWMAWQGFADGQADIWLADVAHPDGRQRLTRSDANEWAPAIAADARGNIHVAFDSYEAGNYDVLVRSWSAAGGLSAPITIAGSDRYEARPSIAADARGRLWIAYEERTAQWGKDSQNLLDGKGSSLYRTAAVKVRCLDGTQVLEAPDPLGQAPEPVKPYNSFPRLTIDRSGRVCLAFRHREESIWGSNSVMVQGAVWLEYITALDGRAWAVPQVLPRSDGLLDNRPALVAPGQGPALVFYSTDGRLRRELELSVELQTRYFNYSGSPGGPQRIFDMDLEVAALPAGATPQAIASTPSAPASDPAPEGRPLSHAGEAADVARLRAHRIQADGKAYRLLRGEFHRHTEISLDGGSDGALEDMWRYAIDAGRLDWIGAGDHDSGAGKEYTWWLIEKTTDLYTLPPRFVPMFSYERSVNYPYGHRNAMFARRGVRTLPRLVSGTGISEDDTKMFYDYLAELGGICASHTSATGGGTDWRDNNAQVEPIVEIFQGFRNSYEHLGGPRVARSRTDGDLRPLGIVWNALGLQYRLGFQASSDHVSTHISYAIAMAEDFSRPAILDALRRRHCYGATDNILLDVRCGEHLMGDEFTAGGPITLKILAHGTGPIARVDVIKDFVNVYSTEPHTERVALTWTDDEKRCPGLSWIYVRVIQEDGELAWGSPFWVHQTAAGSDSEPASRPGS